MTAAPALLAAAAGVAIGHAVLPDHWVPLAVLGRAQGYSLGRVTRLAAAAGIAHVITSLLLGGVVIAIGLQFRSAVEGVESAVVGSMLIATGVAFGAFELVSRHRARPGPHLDHKHHHDRPTAPASRAGEASTASPERSAGRMRAAAAVMVPFGAAASPDLTILPVFLAATAVGVGASVATLVAFSLVTIVGIVALTVGASVGSHQLELGSLDRWGNATTALVLVIVGLLVITVTI